MPILLDPLFVPFSPTSFRLRVAIGTEILLIKALVESFNSSKPHIDVGDSIDMLQGHASLRFTPQVTSVEYP